MTAKRLSKLAVRWRLAEYLESCASDVRSAQKPADLTFPACRIIYLAREIKENQYEWLEKTLGHDPRSRGRWPRL